MEILWALLGFCIIMAIISAIFSEKSNNNSGSGSSDPLEQLNEGITKTYKFVFGDPRTDCAQQLSALHSFAKNYIKNSQQEYWETNEITDTCNTFSDLHLCGVSKTHLHCHLDIAEYGLSALIDAEDPTDKYRQVVVFTQKEADSFGHIAYPEKPKYISEIKRLLNLYTTLKEKGLKLGAEKIALDDIKYFKIEGSQQYVSDVQGGGVNMQGAAMGAVLAGGAGAIIGSQLGTQTKTEIKEKDTRRVILVLNKGGQWTTETLYSLNTSKTIYALRRLIPQKEESTVKMYEEEKKQAVSAISSADELMKFKQLMDAGIITQEEFDAKKAQILGL